MGLLDLFRPKPAIRDLPGLADFLDSRAAFLTQKCIWEYSRARAGPHWRGLFQEDTFLAALKQSSWTNYPLMLGAVAEGVEGVLRIHAPEARAALNAGIAATVRSVTQRHTVPQGFPADFWDAAAERIAARIAKASGAPPRPAHALPLRGLVKFLAAMPIHPDLRAIDDHAIANNLRVGMCHVYDEFVARSDKPALAAALVMAGASLGPGDVPPRPSP